MIVLGKSSPTQVALLLQIFVSLDFPFRVAIHQSFEPWRTTLVTIAHSFRSSQESHGNCRKNDEKHHPEYARRTSSATYPTPRSSWNEGPYPHINVTTQAARRLCGDRY